MLNRLARYRPVVRLIRERRPASILEIGSGALGVGEFSRRAFVGADIAFDGTPLRHMRAVKASAVALPFPDASFDMVICMDALEHVPPEGRTKVVHEALRVTRSVLVLAYPWGKPAREADGRLLEWCRTAGVAVPPWLDEHMRADFPEEETVTGILGSLDGLTWHGFGNENLRAHFLLMILEMHPRRWVRRMASWLRYALTPLARLLLALTDRPPYYRKMFAITKRQGSGRAEPTVGGA